MTDSILLKTIAAILVVGAECALIGVFIFLMNIPFVGVAIAHSAMAGGIWGLIAGVPPKLSAFLGSLAASFVIGPVSDRAKMSANITLSIIFSMVMGIAFLGIGLIEGSDAQVLSFLWGNIFLTGWGDIAFSGAVLAVLVILTAVFYRKYAVILFNRELADAAGVNTRVYYYMILIMIGAVITVNLNTIGGLMLFSLIITPPAIAYQLTFDLKNFFLISAVSGMTGGAAGVIVSFLFDWPVSASVVIVTSLLFLCVLAVSPKRRLYNEV